MRYSALTLLLLGTATAQETRENAGLRPFLERHCFECHGPDSKKKALKLDLATWVKVYDRVAAGEMPPRRKVDSAAFLKTLGEWLTRESRQERPVFRRLNNAEYENTLRDLLGLPTLSARILLPEDGRAEGFSKVAGALDLSHIQLARAMDITDQALDLATAPRPDTPPTKTRFSVGANFGDKFWEGDVIFITKDRKWNRDYIRPPNGTPADFDVQQRKIAASVDSVGVFRPEFYKFPYKFWIGYRQEVRAPVAGWYRLRLSVWSFLFDKGEIKSGTKPQVALLRAGPRPAAYIDVPIQPRVHEVDLWLEKGELAGFSAHSLVFDRPSQGLKGLDKQTKAGIAIDWAEMEGPIVKEPPRRLDDLEQFARRAFRRPVSKAELDRYRKLGAKAILTSPDFLFLNGSLASRLSYFLWNSMPDDALLDADLRKPDVLRAQVERMLQDPKGERFIEDFTDQWLELRDIDLTCPDTNLYPEYNPYLKDCMVGESRAFFREMVRADRPAVEIVQSDWAMLNQGIAEFYGIPGVLGSAYRKVTLPPGSHRGGVLTQAAVLKVTANGTTTTPVRRGAWVLQNILNRPPDPPPPDIPAVEPDIKGATTIREQLEKHRSQAVCASCHSKIDPHGMALESFDVMGGWRTRYRSLGAGERTGAIGLKGRPLTFFLAKTVDPSGELPDRSAFKDVTEFKRLLARDPERIARAMVEKLLVYATGAPLAFADRAAVDEILRRTRSKGFGIRSLIHEVVASPIFLSK